MNEEDNRPAGKSSFIWIILIVIVVILAGFGGWYFFVKKSPEGGGCLNETKCEQGLKCINKTCSSGKVGSSCSQKSDCQIQFCVSGKCTEGKKGNTCINYKDCQQGLLCLKNVCDNPPDYSKYFSKITVSKIKPGLPPGPNNVPVPTTEFKTTDGIEIDLAVKSSQTVGEFYFDIVDSKTGEIAKSGIDNKQQVEGRDRGTGTDLPLPPGTYDLNVYFNSELVYSTPITISQ